MRPRKCPLPYKGTPPTSRDSRRIARSRANRFRRSAMPQRHRVLTALLVTPLIALVVTAVLHRPADARDRHRADPPCPTDCGVKLDRGPWVYAGDRPVTAICVKAGRERF